MSRKKIIDKTHITNKVIGQNDINSAINEFIDFLPQIDGAKITRDSRFYEVDRRLYKSFISSLRDKYFLHYFVTNIHTYFASLEISTSYTDELGITKYINDWIYIGEIKNQQLLADKTIQKRPEYTITEVEQVYEEVDGYLKIINDMTEKVDQILFKYHLLCE